MPSEKPVKNTFEDFCEHTSLHGWQHIGRVKTRNGRLVWLVIVVASLGVASVFLATAAKDFVNRSVVTTIDTTTASLQVGVSSKLNYNLPASKVVPIPKVYCYCGMKSNFETLTNS